MSPQTKTPTTNFLENIVRLAEMGGIIFTAIGIALMFCLDPDGRPGGYVASVGLIFTFIGFVAEYKRSKHQKVEKAADDARIEELENRLWECAEIAKDPAVADALSDWAVKHQDDGR